MSFLKTLRLLFINILGLTFSSLIIKRRGLIIFEPLHNNGKLTGNVKYVYEGLTKDRVSFDIKVISPSDKAGLLKLIKYLSLVAKSDYIVTDQTNMLLSLGNYRIIQLWHGTGYKNIGLLESKFEKRNFIYKFLKRSAYKKFKYIICNSQSDLERKSKSFNNNNVYLTGSPRNDLLFINEKKHSIGDLDLHAYKNVISYLPTYRPFSSSIPFSRDFLLNLNFWLEKNNSVFIIKSHPKDKVMEIPDECSNILDCTKTIKDVQELLALTDVMITDYSGVATDFSLLNKPIIFYMHDFDQFLKESHTFYYDLKEILPRSICETEEKVLNMLMDLSWFNEKEYINSFQEYQTKFNYFKDSNSTQRVLNLIKETVK
ncbi:hypothetical protein EH196_17290 [Bacillus sp. C1-1]|nr:hypothetical protein EH196_17290 [Bacillus sp. C1-1]